MPVYFLECPATKLIKIGRTRSLSTLPGRIRSLSTICPAPLTLLGILTEEDLDHPLHIQFKHIHDHGEWFTPTGELKAFIKENTIVPDFGSQVSQNGQCRAITGKGESCSNAADSLDGYCKIHGDSYSSQIREWLSTGKLIRKTAGELQIGDTLVSSTGSAGEVTSVVKETARTRWFQLKDSRSQTAIRSLRKTVLILVINQDYQSKDQDQ